jgi:hypothetical protein
VERSAGWRRTVDPSPFHKHDKESPLPPRLELLDFLKDVDVPVLEVLEHGVVAAGIAAHDLGRR